MIHDLKLWPEYFDVVASGVKSFEVRKNDRKFAVGDELLLREWEPRTESYTGRVTRKRVTYMAHGLGNVGVVGPIRGLSLGYVVLALGRVDDSMGCGLESGNSTMAGEVRPVDLVVSGDDSSAS